MCGSVCQPVRLCLLNYHWHRFFQLLQPISPILFIFLNIVDSFVLFRHLTKMQNFLSPVITDMKPRIMKSVTLARHESGGCSYNVCVCMCVCVCVCERERERVWVSEWVSERERIGDKMMCEACSCCEEGAHGVFSKLFSKYLDIMYTTYVQACLCL